MTDDSEWRFSLMVIEPGLDPRMVKIRAEMARAAMFPHQLRPYPDPDVEATIDPLGTADGQQAVRRFMSWLEGFTRPFSENNTSKKASE